MMMMMIKSFVFFCIISCVLSAPADTDNDNNDKRSGNRQCPGGYTHGTKVDIGRYWYECVNGQMMPKGCLSDEDQSRVQIGGTFDAKNTFRMQCVLNGDGYLSVIYKSCVQNGQEHQVGDQWDDQTAFYACAKDGPNSLQVHMLGCVDQGGRRANFEDKIAKGESLVQCKKSADGTPKMNVVGCVKDNRKYAIGETFEASKFWFTCTDKGAKIVGCMHEGQRLQDGDRFITEDVVYRCAVDGDKTDFLPYSCLQRENGASIERRLGCFWVEGQYQMTCKHDTDSKKAVKVQNQCNYKSAQGAFNLEPGCVRVVENLAVGCVKDSSSGMLSLRTFPADQADRTPGLRQC